MVVGDKVYLEESNFILILQDIDLKNCNTKHIAYIYCLSEPTEINIRYIGITINLRSRYTSHCCEKENTWKSNWVQSLRTKKLKPKLFLLGMVDKSLFSEESDFYKYVDKVETEAIKTFAINGSDLTNHDKLITSKYNYSKNNLQQKNSKVVYQFNNEFELIKSWNSLKEITSFFSVGCPTVSTAIKNQTRVKGYYFSFENEFSKIYKSQGKKCYVYKISGEFFAEYKSVTEASRILNIHRSDLSDCLNGRQKSAKGYLISYQKLDKLEYLADTHKSYRIQQFDLENNLINTFESVTKAAKVFNVSKTAICNCAQGKSKTCKGFIWKYVL